MKRFREGDYIETKEGLLFHVKGILHPSKRVIAFLRYVPSKEGTRDRNGNKYRKIYPIKERYNYLNKKYPKYIFYSEKIRKKIQSVPIKDIKEVYRPQEKLEEIREKKKLTEIEKVVADFSEKIINESGIDQEKLGVSGSILVNLQEPDSDIDLIGYGKEEGWKIYSAVKKLRESDTEILGYDRENAFRMAEFRWGKTGLPIKPFAKIEEEKVLHGLVRERDFFIRLVKDWFDIDLSYSDLSYTPVGKAKIKGTISNDSDSIFTPNHYGLEESETLNGNTYEVEEIASYRGRFTEQATKGDEIIAKGRVEEVSREDKNYYRMLLGQPNEYLLPIREDLKLPEQIKESETEDFQ